MLFLLLLLSLLSCSLVVVSSDTSVPPQSRLCVGLVHSETAHLVSRYATAAMLKVCLEDSKSMYNASC